MSPVAFAQLCDFQLEQLLANQKTTGDKKGFHKVALTRTCAQAIGSKPGCMITQYIIKIFD